jgi:hypothetical protein
LANHKDIENARNNRQEDHFKARRRLLKASAAAPLIGTLSPGAALASASTQCDINETNFPEAVSVDDKALRVVSTYWKANNDNIGNDLYQVGDTYYDAEDGSPVVPDRNGGGRIKGYKNEGTRYVLCYVDIARDSQSGDVDFQQVRILGFYPQQNTFGTAISDSCWDSIGGLQHILHDQVNG